MEFSQTGLTTRLFARAFVRRPYLPPSSCTRLLSLSKCCSLAHRFLTRLNQMYLGRRLFSAWSTDYNFSRYLILLATTSAIFPYSFRRVAVSTPPRFPSNAHTYLGMPRSSLGWTGSLFTLLHFVLRDLDWKFQLYPHFVSPDWSLLDP